MNPRQATVPEADDLDSALALTETLRGHVEAGRWDEAADLEAGRRFLLERFFERTPAASDLPRVVTRLRQLVVANDTLVGMADHVQRALEREADTLMAGKRAVRAYGNPTR